MMRGYQMKWSGSTTNANFYHYHFMNFSSCLYWQLSSPQNYILPISAVSCHLFHGVQHLEISLHHFVLSSLVSHFHKFHPFWVVSTSDTFHFLYTLHSLLTCTCLIFLSVHLPCYSCSFSKVFVSFLSSLHKLHAFKSHKLLPYSNLFFIIREKPFVTSSLNLLFDLTVVTLLLVCSLLLLHKPNSCSDCQVTECGTFFKDGLL